MTDKLREAAQAALEAWDTRAGIGAATAAFEDLRAALAEEPHREHITDGTPCWCNPEINYTDPETGISVIVHKEPQ